MAIGSVAQLHRVPGLDRGLARVADLLPPGGTLQDDRRGLGGKLAVTVVGIAGRVGMDGGLKRPA